MNKFVERFGSRSGKPALIVASGPSVQGLDPNRAKRCVVIAVNAGILSVPEADFFFSCDIGVLSFEYWNEVCKGAYPVLLDPQGCAVESFYRPGLTEERFFPFSRAKTRSFNGETLIWGINSAHAATHFAHLLGCEPIYLIGCDCKYKNGNKYGWELNNDERGRHKSGARSLWIGSNRKIGRPMGDREYAVGANGIKDGILASGVNEWRRIVEVNPHVDIRDASNGALAEFVKQVSLEEVYGE